MFPGSICDPAELSQATARWIIGSAGVRNITVLDGSDSTEPSSLFLLDCH